MLTELHQRYQRNEAETKKSHFVFGLRFPGQDHESNATGNAQVTASKQGPAGQRPKTTRLVPRSSLSRENSLCIVLFMDVYGSCHMNINTQKIV